MKVRFTGGGIEPMVIDIELEVIPRVGELVFMGDGITRHVVYVSHHYGTRTFHQEDDPLWWELAPVQGELRWNDQGPVVRIELGGGLPT